MNRVLVIDDEPIIRKSYERLLAPEGFHVTSAESGQEGLDILGRESFGVVLLDFKMPDIDGMDVLKEIRAKWPEIKVIIITGYSTPETADEAMKLGALDHINKPFIPDLLIEAVKKAFEDS